MAAVRPRPGGAPSLCRSWYFSICSPICRHSKWILSVCLHLINPWEFKRDWYIQNRVPILQFTLRNITAMQFRQFMSAGEYSLLMTWGKSQAQDLWVSRELDRTREGSWQTSITSVIEAWHIHLPDDFSCHENKTRVFAGPSWKCTGNSTHCPSLS